MGVFECGSGSSLGSGEICGRYAPRPALWLWLDLEQERIARRYKETDDEVRRAIDEMLDEMETARRVRPAAAR